MERFLLVANWKANIVRSLQFAVHGDDNVEIAIAPSYPHISDIPEGFTKAAQDISRFPAGPYTGEVPGQLLADLDVKYCLVGHSERRKFLRETNVEIEEKVKQAIDNNIIPIICAQTLEEIPANIRNYSGGKFMIMYEPFFAISTAGEYHPESPDKIIAILTDWKNKLDLDCRFLYGGSISPNDVANYLSPEIRPLVSGFVIGHASLDPTAFSDIIKKCLQSLS